MSDSIIISKHVLETIKSLPGKEREVIAKALASDLLLGDDPVESLSSFQAMIYSVIRYYVKRDTERMAAGLCGDEVRCAASF